MPSPSFDQRKFIEFLEKYLQGLVSNLLLVNTNVLNFLNVLQEDQSPFLMYQDLFTKNKTSIMRGKNRLNLIPQNSNNSKDDYNNYSLTTSPAKQFFSFEIVCLSWKRVVKKEETTVLYEFQLTHHLRKKQSQTWRIQKSYSEIKNFHLELEKQLLKQISLFHDLVPRASNYSLLSDDFLEIRKQGLEKYLQAILSNKTYFCLVLFDFLDFDPELEKPNCYENELETKSLTAIKMENNNAFNWIVEDPAEEIMFDFSRATPRHIKNLKQQTCFRDCSSPYFKSNFQIYILY